MLADWKGQTVHGRLDYVRREYSHMANDKDLYSLKLMSG